MLLRVPVVFPQKDFNLFSALDSLLRGQAGSFVRIVFFKMHKLKYTASQKIQVYFNYIYKVIKVLKCYAIKICVY